MIRGPKPRPTALQSRIPRGDTLAHQIEEVPDCPEHLGPVARAEWQRLAPLLFRLHILTPLDRAAFAACCQSYARWVEAEDHLARTPMIVKTPSGYIQQSPWLGIANRQLELMGRYLAELGLTPVARARMGLPEFTGLPGSTPDPDLAGNLLRIDPMRPLPRKAAPAD